MLQPLCQHVQGRAGAVGGQAGSVVAWPPSHRRRLARLFCEHQAVVAGILQAHVEGAQLAGGHLGRAPGGLQDRKACGNAHGARALAAAADVMRAGAGLPVGPHALLLPLLLLLLLRSGANDKVESLFCCVVHLQAGRHGRLRHAQTCSSPGAWRALPARPPAAPASWAGRAPCGSGWPGRALALSLGKRSGGPHPGSRRCLP